MVMIAPGIQDLRLFQWGRETARAQINLTVDVLPTAGDTFTIGDIVYTFLAAGAAVAGELNVGVSLAASQANIIAAVNGTDGWNVPNPKANIGAFATNVAVVKANTAGTNGNAVATTETFTAVTNIFSGALLVGGLDRGVFVPATSKMLIANWDVEPADEVYHPPLLRGIIQRWKGGEIVVQRGTRWTIPETPFFYEQAHNWGLMSVRGGVEPTGAGPTYTWNFVRDPTGNPDIDTFTIERRLSNGYQHIDQRVAYNMVSRITWRGAQSAPVLFTADGFGRRLKNNPITAALTAPTGEAALSSSSKVFIDTLWANLGVTQYEGQILNWEIAFMTGYAPLFTTDGRADLDFTVASLSSENTQLEVKITMLVDPTTNGKFLTEQAAAESQINRAVRIQCDGTAGRQVQWDMMLKHNQGSLFKIGEFEGQDMVEMTSVETSDQTNLFAMKVVNLINTLT